MKYGHFDDKNREYVITNPRTPWPWINYLGNEDWARNFTGSAISGVANLIASCRSAVSKPSP